MDKLDIMKKIEKVDMIFEQSVSTRAKIVYLYLCECANSGGQSSPGRKTIAKSCSICERTVDKAVAELIDAGLLSMSPRVNEDGERMTNLCTI